MIILNFIFLYLDCNKFIHDLRLSIQEKLKSNFIKKFSIYGFGQFFNLVTPLLLVPYIVKTCGEANFGKISVCLSICFFLIVFIDYGSELVGVRDVSINRNNKEALQKIFLVNLVSRFFLLTSIILITLSLAYFIPFLKSEFTLFSFSVLILIGQYLNQSWFLQGVENVNWISLSNIFSKLIYVAGVLIFIKTKNDYQFVNLYFAAGTIISNGFFTFLIFRKYKFSFHKINSSDILNFLSKDFKMFSSQIFTALQLYSPVLIVSVLGNNFMAGQYRIVEQIIVTFKTYIFLFFNFTYPRVCYDIIENSKKAIQNWFMINFMNILFIIFLMTLLYFNADLVITFFNASDTQTLSKLLQIALLIPIALAISIALKQLILGFNFHKQYIRITIFTVLLSLLMIAGLMINYQLLGVVYSLIITEIIVILFYLICIKMQLGKSPLTND